MDNQNQNQILAGMIQRWQIAPGLLTPRMLVADTTSKEGDIFYVNSKGIFARLPIGSANQLLTVSSSGIPEWGDTVGYSGTVTLAKLTTANGSLTVVDGRITSYTAPT